MTPLNWPCPGTKNYESILYTTKVMIIYIKEGRAVGRRSLVGRLVLNIH